MQDNYPISRSYNSFSDVSMFAYPIGKQIKYAAIQAIHYVSERKPQLPYSMMGSPDPRLFRRSRYVSGTIMFAEFYHPEPLQVFDVILNADDDCENTAVMSIREVKILDNNGNPWTPDHMYELFRPYQYTAKDIVPWKFTEYSRTLLHI